MTVQPSSKTAADEAYDYLETTGYSNNSNWLDQAKQWIIDNYKQYFPVVKDLTVFVNNVISIITTLRRRK